MSKKKNKTQSNNPISQSSSDKPITVDDVHPEHKPSEEIKPSISADHTAETKEPLPGMGMVRPMDHQPAYPQITVSQSSMVYGSGIINLVPEPLYRQLQIENTELKEKIHNMKIQENLLLNSNQELRDTIKCNEQTIEALKKENAELKLELEDLRKHVEELERKNSEQDNRITEQDKRITEQNKRIAEQNSHIKILKDDIDDLKKRDDPITARELFSVLEDHIFHVITNNQKELGDNLYDLFNDSEYKTECDNFLKNYKLTKKQVLAIPQLKKPGNYQSTIISNIYRITINFCYSDNFSVIFKVYKNRY
jgi:uncharacterized coiled-coil protein SlyX